MNTRKTAAIILAAGRSSRMGKPKPLLPLGNTTIVNHVVSIFSQFNLDVILVLGHRRDDILPTIVGKQVTIADNPDYDSGMFTSVQAGVRKLPPGCKNFFIMPVDIPLVRPATVAHLLQKSKNQPEKIIYPFFGGRRGHPPLIPANLIPSILQFSDEGGLKGALSQANERAIDLPVPDAGILFDIDTPADYEALLRMFQNIDLPTQTERQFLLHDICRTPPQVINHCREVAEVALTLSQKMKLAGLGVDMDLVRAAAELHDMLRTLPEHEKAAAEALRSYGFGRVGDVIATHMDMPENTSNLSLESKIVFLADKMVDGTHIGDIEERYDFRIRNAPPEAIPLIIARKERALKIKREIETMLNAPLSTCIKPSVRH